MILDHCSTRHCLLDREGVSPAQRRDMFQLLAKHFDGVSEEVFEADLAEKSHVILIERAGQLVGFTTLAVFESSFENEVVTVVYSGDTIVAQEAWNTPALPRAWIAAVNSLRGQHPRGRLYWLLLTSGFRTYRLLPVFWRLFYPRHEQSTPAREQKLLNQLASERFHKQFDPARGIVRLTQPQVLKDSVVPPGRLRDPHIAFYLDRNPGCHHGDELVCITELTPSNLTRAGLRMAAAK